MEVDDEEIKKRYAEIVKEMLKTGNKLIAKYGTDWEEFLKKDPPMEDLIEFSEMIASLAVITEYKNLFWKILPDDDYGFD